MVGLTLFGTCAIDKAVRRIKEKVDRMETAVNQAYGRQDQADRQSPECRNLRTENVLGGSEPESFYEIDGRRAYVSIDGKLIQ